MRPSRQTTSSYSAQPIPCATPPSICPVASVGLMTLPISCTATKSSTRVSHVRVSTDTSATYTAHPYVPYASPVYVSSSQWSPGGGVYWLVSRNAPNRSTYRSHAL